MNNYQNALHFLSIDEDCNDTECNECSIKKICRKYSAIQTLQEAIDKTNKYDEKETPKKYKVEISIDAKITFKCPNCCQILKTFKGVIETVRPIPYCFNCGQALDWSDE